MSANELRQCSTALSDDYSDIKLHFPSKLSVYLISSFCASVVSRFCFINSPYSHISKVMLTCNVFYYFTQSFSCMFGSSEVGVEPLMALRKGKEWMRKPFSYLGAP
ncbi:hypothetical protein S83_068723 [Arachis hypogaea]|nr:uncharacterized protein DS421_20g681150 [Arachis hypogaea]